MAPKALLVGVNKYCLPGCDLKGCVNDVTNMRDVLLKYFGFKAEQVRLVVDERATREAILERLEWLVKDAGPADRVLFHFSGHGSQVRDRDGDELRDHMDEVICPHDMNWEGNYISDDDLKEIFVKLPQGAVLEVILDCCHSGTGTREAAALNLLPMEMAMRPRFLEPPADIQARVDEELPVRRLLRGANPTGHVLFAGCRENQTSADAFIGGAFNGAFTYYLCRHLRDNGGDIPRGELLRRVRASLKFNGFSQVPQLEGPKCSSTKRMLELFQ